MNALCDWLRVHINAPNPRHPLEIFISIILAHLELCHWEDAFYFVECALPYSTTLEEQAVLDFLKNLACYETPELIEEALKAIGL